MSEVRRVLGIDPGSRVTGWGVVDRGDRGALRLVAFGTIRTPAEATFSRRLRVVHEGLLAVLGEHRPDAVAVEEAFAGLNIRSAIRLGEARAVALLAAELQDKPVHELSPSLVKKVVAGHGQAGKDTVRGAVLRLLGVTSGAFKRSAVGADDDRPVPYDATDALALAVSAITRLDVPPELRPSPVVGKKARRRGWTMADVERLGGAPPA
jgi:crossover junction endodeoxyribonuclease RuvC